MGNYASKIRRPPRILTPDEQVRILRVTGQKRDDLRDHVIISIAMGTGLRQKEIAELDVADVLKEAGRVASSAEKIRRQVRLRFFKGSRGGAKQQHVFLTDANMAKLGRYLIVRLGNPGAAGPALFLSVEGKRIAPRTIRHLWREWQKRAGFDDPYPFHALRHTAITNAYRRQNDIGAAQRFARHASLSTTGIYTHVSDADLLAQVKGLRS